MSFRVKDQVSQQAVDMNQLFERIAGAAIIDGLEPSIGTGLEISIASGNAFVNGERVSVSSQTVSLEAADSEKPRKDLLTVDSNGDIKVYTGLPEDRRPENEDRFNAQRPAPADLQGISEPPVAEVFVDSGSSSLVADDLLDRRTFADFIANKLTLEERPRDTDQAVTKLYSDAQFTLHETSVLLGPGESLTMDRFALPSGRVIQVTGANLTQENGTGEIELFDHTTQETKLIIDSPELNVGEPLYEGSLGNEVEIRLVNFDPDVSETLTAKVSYNIVDE